MADTKISALTALTSFSDDDVLPCVDSPASSAQTKKITVLNAKRYFWSGKGADIASASTIDLAASKCPYVEITGTTGITAISSADAGTIVLVRFTGALTITHNATSLILPGGRNITTAAGDRAIFISLGSGNWECHEFLKADGRSLGDVPVTTHSTSESVTSASMYGGTHRVTAAATLTLPAAVVGMSGNFRATTAAVMSLDPNGSEVMLLPGGAVTAGNKISSDGSQYASVYLECTITGYWDCYPSSVFVDGGSS